MTIATRADDLEILGRQLRDHPVMFQSLTGDVSTEVAFETLREDGTWADIDYETGKDYRIFPPAVHLRRLNLILDSADNLPDAAGRAKRRHAAHLALSAWLRLDLQSNQGWFQTIGVPQLIGRAALQFENELTPEEKAKVLQMLRRCVREDGELIYAHAPATGQNLQWQASLQIVGGYLERNPERIERYVRRIEREIRVTEEEGIQSDMSFQQHGHQIYAGGYGLGFVTDAARLAVQTRGTRFALANETIELLIRLLLDGQQGMLRGRNWDFTAIGREIARKDRDALALATAADQFATFDGSRSGELRAFARRVRGDDPVSTTPAKFRVFWRSDFVSQTRPGFYFSARMTSTRMNGSEAGNGENELGCYLGDGATAIMGTGEEYRGIFPIWDWRRIPGVTNAYEPAVPLPLYKWGEGYAAGSDFAGGAGDNENGLAAMTLDRLGVHAEKAWFFLGDIIVCLGSDIRASDAKAPLITTLNQCWASRPLTTGTEWAHHDGISYLNIGEGSLRAQIVRQSGNWRAVDRLQGSPAEVSGDVFTAYIEHVKSSSASASYAYIIAPGLASEAIGAFMKNGAPLLLANTAALQAIESASGDIVQAVFRLPGELKLPDGRTLRVDAPCLLQLRQNSATEWTLTAGNPTQKVRLLNVSLNFAFEGQTARPDGDGSVITFEFPSTASNAGKPQVLQLRKRH